MTTEAMVRPVLSATTITEQASDLTQQVKEFYDRNHTSISVAAILAVTVFLTRSIVRHELTRLSFIVDVVSEPDFIDLGNYTDLD